MDHYLVETEHTEGNCTLVIGEVHSMGYLRNFDWGCAVGVHCGWAIIEAEGEEHALLTVPLIVRPKARAVRLIKFTEADLERSHPR